MSQACFVQLIVQNFYIRCQLGRECIWHLAKCLSSAVHLSLTHLFRECVARPRGHTHLMLCCLVTPAFPCAARPDTPDQRPAAEDKCRFWQQIGSKRFMFKSLCVRVRVCTCWRLSVTSERLASGKLPRPSDFFLLGLAKQRLSLRAHVTMIREARPRKTTDRPLHNGANNKQDLT